MLRLCCKKHLWYFKRIYFGCLSCISGNTTTGYNCIYIYDSSWFVNAAKSFKLLHVSGSSAAVQWAQTPELLNDSIIFSWSIHFYNFFLIHPFLKFWLQIHFVYQRHLTKSFMFRVMACSFCFTHYASISFWCGLQCMHSTINFVGDSTLWPILILVTANSWWIMLQ